ncbi:hypothetical protein ACT29I_14855 [Saccharicrinis sp. GN24d3]
MDEKYRWPHQNIDKGIYNMEFAFLPIALILFVVIFRAYIGLGMEMMAPLKREAW